MQYLGGKGGLPGKALARCRRPHQFFCWCPIYFQAPGFILRFRARGVVVLVPESHVLAQGRRVLDTEKSLLGSGVGLLVSASLVGFGDARAGSFSTPPTGISATILEF